MSNGKYGTTIDPEDMFADTRMSFGDHLEDLRTHLWRAVKGFILALILALCFGNQVVKFIAAPVETQLQAFYARVAAQKAAADAIAAKQEDYYTERMATSIRVDRQKLREAVGLPPLENKEVLGPTVQAFERLLANWDAAYLIDRKNLAKDSSFAEIDVDITDPAFKRYITKSARESTRTTLVTLNVTEAFMVYFKVSMVTGLIIGSPWIFYQIWSFVAVGLYPHEKKYVNYYLPFSIGLFLAGAALCQFMVIPKAIEVLLSFNDWMGLEPDLRLNEWLSFAMMMPLIFGISFQTPLVMLFTDKIGILEADTYRSYRKIAWFILAIFAAIITPTVDAVSMLFLWVPLCLLYELGILLAWFQPKTPFEDVETPESEEMVEV